MADQWHFSINGNQSSPVSSSELKQLASCGKLSRTDLIWKEGMANWIPAEKLKGLFPIQGTAAPTQMLPPPPPLQTQDQKIPNLPPLGDSDIDNKFIWLIVAVPIVGVIIELIAGKELVWLYMAANIVCCGLDVSKLKKQGNKAPSTWMLFLVPIYLWKRATLLNQKRYYFWAWCAAWILSICLGIGGHELVLEESACPIVTQIIQQQLSGTTTCKAVNITEEVSDGFYKAIATLDNGNELLITIEEKKGGAIYVQIPNQ